jgi:hypothetical protein
VADRPPRRLRSIIHLTQAHSFGPLARGEDCGTLTVADNVAHLDTIVAGLEWHVRALEGEAQPKLFALVDTLHLTQCHRPGVVAFADVAGIDRRLAALGAKLVFLSASPEVLWERGIWTRRGEEFMIGYAFEKWGSTLEDVHRYFIGEQAAMRAHLAHTRMEHLSLCVDGGLSTYVDEAYDFWLRPSADRSCFRKDDGCTRRSARRSGC